MPRRPRAGHGPGGGGRSSRARRPGDARGRLGQRRKSEPSAGHKTGSQDRAAAERDAENSARRPGTRRSRTGVGAGRRQFQRRSGGRFTRRAAVLAMVFAVLVLSLAYPVRQYFAQRAEIDRIEASQRAQSERIAKLRDRKAQWSDPEYIKAQARKRLQYVEPGEVAYVIIEDPAAKRERERVAERDGPAEPKREGSWYARFWSSVESADRPVAAEK